jgi:glucose 1-dehydrogenase
MDAVMRDQWTVVTGGSMGIGLGIARRFREAGAHVVLVARRADALAEAAAHLEHSASTGQRIITHQADTSDPDSIGALFDFLDTEIPRVDTYVANAGSGVLRPFLEISLEEWRTVVDFNLTGTFLGCQAAARRMVQSEGTNRSILVVSSIRALGARPGVSAYAATKAALNQMVRVAAYELAPHGVRINALLPGITVTPLVLDNNPHMIAERTKDVPMGRPGSPEDMAEAALYLSSEAARFVTGVNLVVDGGESLW